ncbi:MAG: aminotransferase class I/II-fold pyridoxal phosphate-dependent enzyme [Ferruginibacter sp.]
MQPAKRLDGINEYYFSQKLREIDAMNKAGKQVINLGIGSPDLPPHPDVIKTLFEEASKPNTHAYQNYKGSPLFRNAIAKWYSKNYSVELDAETEILPLIGSKEGIMHICMTYFDETSSVLVPNPGYPTYASAIKLTGAAPLFYELKKENNYYPDFDQLEILIKENADKPVKGLFVNYPQMPTGQLPSKELFENLVAFAKKHNILLIHDNPYSFILNSNPMSLLCVDGAKDVAIELNSLSKSHNMAGWRVGMLVAAKEKIAEVLRFKSNMDSGMFLPVQLAAVKALELEQDWFDELNKIYKERRVKVFELLELLHCDFDETQAGMFVWAAIPGTFKDGFELSDKVLHETGVFITPGGIFGTAGNKYIRVSLCSSTATFEKAISRIKDVQ